ncbi:hypothetical protein [Planctomycetes bacterium K23_9]|uniref:Uncharacterized protein n=1 Tax=Stieleria marina TaxID=1930275 RepID=A0A517NSJ7_9BACT|nr:hypothetical protein K239x_20610 [Planctomycetes bacterium K23_9]
MKIQPHKPTGWWTHKRQILCGLIPALAIGCLLTTVGCSSMSQGMMAPYGQSGCRLCTDLRAKATARVLWSEQYAHCYGNAANSKDIRKGFVDGFVATAQGGSGCTPLVPPTCYCGLGKRLNAKCWFQGYPLGVAAAQSSGACNWCKMAISPDLAACMATDQCTPGCVPCAQNAGVMHNGMVHDQFNAPPVPMDVYADPIIDDPNAQIQQDFPTPADDASTSTSDEAAENLEMTEDAERGFNNEGESIDAPKGEAVDEPSAEAMDEESEAGSPSDRSIVPPAAIEPIQRNDDLTNAAASADQQIQVLASSEPIPVASPVQQTPVAGGPITMPAMESAIETAAEAADANAPPVPVAVPTSDAQTSTPVVGEPVQLPNIQVSFDMDGVDWLFGEVDIAQAVLSQEFQVPLSQ